MPSSSQAIPPSPITVPPSPAADVNIQIEDCIAGDEGRAAALSSPICRRQIDFVDEPDMPVISQPPNVVREELQHEQSTTATRISSPIPPSTLSSDSAPVQSKARPVEYVLLTNVQPPSEVSVDVSPVDREMVPPSPPPIVQMEVEETLRVEVPPPTPTIPERVEKVPILEESVPTPFVHEEIAGSTETIPVEEHPPIVQEWLGLIVINATANVQSQPKETSKAHSSMQEREETIQLPFIESSDALVQGRTMYSSINNEEALTEEPPATIDVEVTTSEPLVQSSEVQGILFHSNKTLLKVPCSFIFFFFFCRILFYYK
eukprot:TRINITY_DN23388_c0_g1_i1.p1 TRINITY_DN23388_c0_g1~~TRINITY_DN23388_c0_g1_i1.p1  ORF type:complete len:318 (+),score=63.38 TRINITY_DN23388_c0_g1_i1:2059-3012(+)